MTVYLFSLRIPPSIIFLLTCLLCSDIVYISWATPFAVAFTGQTEAAVFGRRQLMTAQYIPMMSLLTYKQQCWLITGSCVDRLLKSILWHTRQQIIKNITERGHTETLIFSLMKQIQLLADGMQDEIYAIICRLCRSEVNSEEFSGFNLLTVGCGILAGQRQYRWTKVIQFPWF